MTTRATLDEVRELDARSGDGLEVRLLWHPQTDTITVAVLDSVEDELFEVAVEPSEALGAFHHPFAYAAARGVTFAMPLGTAAA